VLTVILGEQDFLQTVSFGFDKGKSVNFSFVKEQITGGVF